MFSALSFAVAVRPAAMVTVIERYCVTALALSSFVEMRPYRITTCSDGRLKMADLNMADRKRTLSGK